MAKVLHFLTDEKFSDFIIHLFEKVPHPVFKYVVVQSPEKPLKFQNPLIERISLAEVNNFERAFAPDLIIFHSLFPQNLVVLDRLESTRPICWFSWGGDIALGHSTIFRKSHEPITFREYFKPSAGLLLKHELWNSVKRFFPRLYSYYYTRRTGELWPNFLLNKHFSRISIINTVTPNERKLFTQHGFSGTFIHIPIGTIEYLTEGVEHHPVSRDVKRIFLGHSAFAQNNQLDVLVQLKTLHFQGEIICSLSYGDTDFSRLVIEKGTTLFGKRFIPITEYLTKERYFNLLNTCDVFVNNSIIQQGLGNILTAAYIGIPVILNHKGLVYEFLKEQHIHCFSLQHDLEQLLVELPATMEQYTQQNRVEIDRLYGEQQVLEKINQLLSVL